MNLVPMEKLVSKPQAVSPSVARNTRQRLLHLYGRHHSRICSSFPGDTVASPSVARETQRWAYQSP